MDIEYIIVQAGGKGSRLGYLTKNKPKALVPIENLPMIFYLFNKYPEKKFIIIGDYKYEVLEKYMKIFSNVEYKLVDSRGYSGTCAGLKSAVELLPENTSFMLIWSDLILPKTFSFPIDDGNYIGVAKDFTCRWKFKNNEFIEEASNDFGVAGVFIFENKLQIKNVPENGEFVRWLSTQKMSKKPFELYNIKEFGLLSEYQKLDVPKCRPFNSISINDGIFTKIGIDEQGRALAKRENKWYEYVINKKFENIPNIYSFSPLKMEYINGENVYKFTSLSQEDKKNILKKMVDCIKSIHTLGSIETDRESYIEAYIGKTFERLEKIRDLVPFANNRTIKINGKTCQNVFYYRDELEKQVMSYIPNKFCFIHGDCTFSNILLKNDNTPILIDPRGYFGTTELYGDPAYDWVKLYYSLVGNYDQFNLKRFSLQINDNDVVLNIQSNNWEDMEEYFFKLLDGEITQKQIKLLHSIIWLSLTTYAWEDYDSICGAFYNGILLFNEIK